MKPLVLLKSNQVEQEFDYPQQFLLSLLSNGVLKEKMLPWVF
jgi:hypothetical protein